MTHTIAYNNDFCKYFVYKFTKIFGYMLINLTYAIKEDIFYLPLSF